MYDALRCDFIRFLIPQTRIAGWHLICRMMVGHDCHGTGCQPGALHEQMLAKVLLKGQALRASTTDIFDWKMRILCWSRQDYCGRSVMVFKTELQILNHHRHTRESFIFCPLVWEFWKRLSALLIIICTRLVSDVICIFDKAVYLTWSRKAHPNFHCLQYHQKLYGEDREDLGALTLK